MNMLKFAFVGLLFSHFGIVNNAAIAQELTQPEEDRVDVSVTLDSASSYFFRGFLQEDNGFILQPGMEIGWDISESGNGSTTLAIGHWSSYHSNGTGAATADDFVETWYEADWYASLGTTRGQWGMGLTWTNYASPSGAFSTIDELALGITYDDSTDEGLSWNPSATLAVELNDQGGSEDMYLEFGVAPEFAINLGSSVFDITVPITLGLSADDYYIDSTNSESTFGYLDVGIEFGRDLDISAAYGDWSWSAGVHMLVLGDGAEDANNGDGSELLGSIGLAIGF